MDKMKNKQFAVGLDIGTTKIVAMVGQKNKFNKHIKFYKETKKTVFRVYE